MIKGMGPRKTQKLFPILWKSSLPILYMSATIEEKLLESREMFQDTAGVHGIMHIFYCLMWSWLTLSSDRNYVHASADHRVRDCWRIRTGHSFHFFCGTAIVFGIRILTVCVNNEHMSISNHRHSWQGDEHIADKFLAVDQRQVDQVAYQENQQGNQVEKHCCLSIWKPTKEAFLAGGLYLMVAWDAETIEWTGVSEWGPSYDRKT